MNRRQSIAVWFASLCCLALLNGCSSTPSAFTPAFSLDVQLAANDDINLFDDGKARPVIVRIYQLNDVGNFDKADYTGLFNSDEAVLADSLIDSKILSPVLPGEERKFTLDVQQQAKFLAVFAEFSRYETATAMSSVALVEDPESYPVYIRIINNQIEITQPVNDPWWKF